LGACLIKWCPSDQNLKARLKKTCHPEQVFPLFSEDDKLTTVSVCNDAIFILLGYDSGKIIAVQHVFNEKELTLDLRTDQV
jgi:hypothetical protein